VVACDFYNAGAVATLSDEDIVRVLMEELLPEAVPGFKVLPPSRHDSTSSAPNFRNLPS
jgi:hypothetical protein